MLILKIRKWGKVETCDHVTQLMATVRLGLEPGWPDPAPLGGLQVPKLSRQSIGARRRPGPHRGWPQVRLRTDWTEEDGVGGGDTATDHEAVWGPESRKFQEVETEKP